MFCNENEHIINTMNFQFDERRATQAAAYLIALNQNELNYMKLIKLLYLSDREALLRWQQPITGDRYYSMRFGPIVSNILDKISSGPNPYQPDYWSTFIELSLQDRYSVTTKKQVDYNELSERERELLKEIDEQFKSYDQWKLADYCHVHLPEWKDPRDSSCLITVEEIIRAGNPSIAESEIHEILELVEFNAFLEQTSRESLHEAR